MSERKQNELVSMSDELIVNIRAKADRPFGVIIYGSDCDYKLEIADKFQEGLLDTIFTNYRSMLEKPDVIEQWLGDWRSLVVVMNGVDSVDSSLRRDCAQRLLDAGAKTLIGVYVKPKNLVNDDAKSAYSWFEQNRLIDGDWQYQIIAEEGVSDST